LQQTFTSTGTGIIELHPCAFELLKISSDPFEHKIWEYSSYFFNQPASNCPPDKV
jgi:hypothetical protein